MKGCSLHIEANLDSAPPACLCAFDAAEDALSPDDLVNARTADSVSYVHGRTAAVS